MAKLVTYKCPVCSGSFDFLHHPTSEPPPDYCQIESCRAFVGDGVEKVPVLHLKIGTHKGAIPDQLYRRLEESSAARAEEAAELVGADKSEMSAIKITDLKDNTREGDVLAVSRTATAAEGQLTVRGGGPAPSHQRLTTEQVVGMQQAASAGANAHSALEFRKKAPHQQLIASKTAAGQMGRY